MKNMIITFQLSSLIITMLAGCLGSPTQTERDTLYVGLASPPTTLDPRMATDATSQRINDLIFSSLVRIGPDLRPAPQDALSWIVSDRKIIFKLRKDIEFSDRSKAHAEDYALSIKEYQKPGGPFASIFSHVKNIVVPDDSTLVFNLIENDASLVINLVDIKLLPQHVLKKNLDFSQGAMIGSGPFQITSFDTNQLTLKKSLNPSYAIPQIEKIVMKFIRDDGTRYLKLVKGDIDLISNEITEDKVVEIRKNPRNLDVIVSPGLNFNYLLLNLKDPLLKDIKVREAINSSLNRNEMIKFQLQDLAQTAGSILAPLNPFSNLDLKFERVELAITKKIISELGLKDREITFKTSTQSSTHGQILAHQIEQTGLKVKLQSYEWGTYYGDVKAGRFQMALMRWVGVVDPDVYRDTLASSETPPGKNRGYYSNSEFDNLVKLGRLEINLEKRKLIYSKAQQIIARDLPIIPLWYNSNITAINRRVKNFEPSPTGSFHSFLTLKKE